MNLTYNNFCSLDCDITDIFAFQHLWKEDTQYNYETHGRTKYLIYYQLENERSYYCDGKLIYTLKKHDILFLPHGAKYTSVITSPENQTTGIGIAFNLYTPDNVLVETKEPIKLVAHDSTGQYYKRFKKILFSVLHPNTNSLRLKGEIYMLLDEMFSAINAKSSYDKSYHDIAEAISVIEHSPEINYTNQQLAEMCFISESSFLRKFKAYSGGVSPLQYRNNIRLMRAEEMVNTTRTLDEIAEMLGFYDAAHLCRIYKQSTGHTLKKKQL